MVELYTLRSVVAPSQQQLYYGISMAAGGLCHWGPISALTIIFELFAVGLYCDVLWFHPLESTKGFVHVIIYVMWLLLILNYFLKSVWFGPGYVPQAWKPQNTSVEKWLQYCTVCEAYKAPRAHHCSKCERCVMKMDHHCPWINICVGHKNQRSFSLFLFFVPIGCTHAAIIMLCCVFDQIFWHSGTLYPRMHTRKQLPFGVYHLMAALFSVGLAVGVTIAVGLLLYYQVKTMLTNKTAIEGWIVEKARHRPRPPEDGDFVYPYNLGRWANIKQVITWSDYVGDGITWHVRPGCDQYVLTREQLEQKKQKRERRVLCSITKPYTGWIITCGYGCRTCLKTPITDEPRLRLQVGDVVAVTRWAKWWLYGEKCPSRMNGSMSGKVQGEKGWFPRQCAARMDEPKKEL